MDQNQLKDPQNTPNEPIEQVPHQSPGPILILSPPPQEDHLHSIDPSPLPDSMNASAPIPSSSPSPELDLDSATALVVDAYADFDLAKSSSPIHVNPTNASDVDNPQARSPSVLPPARADDMAVASHQIGTDGDNNITYPAVSNVPTTTTKSLADPKNNNNRNMAAYTTATSPNNNTPNFTTTKTSLSSANFLPGSTSSSSPAATNMPAKNTITRVQSGNPTYNDPQFEQTESNSNTNFSNPSFQNSDPSENSFDATASSNKPPLDHVYQQYQQQQSTPPFVQPYNQNPHHLSAPRGPRSPLRKGHSPSPSISSIPEDGYYQPEYQQEQQPQQQYQPSDHDRLENNNIKNNNAFPVSASLPQINSGYGRSSPNKVPTSSSYSDFSNQQPLPPSASYPQIVAPVAQPAVAHPAFRQRGMLPYPAISSPSSRSSSPAIRQQQQLHQQFAGFAYAAPESNNSLSSLAPPVPSFSMRPHSPGSDPSQIVRSASTPNVMNSASAPNSPRLSPMLNPQRNSSGNFAGPHPSRNSARLGTPSGSRPFSSLSATSSFDGSGGSGHQTDFYSYTNNGPGGSRTMGGPGHGRTQSMAFTDLAATSAFDLSQTFLSSNLGANSTSLVPRMKTIEMYRKNAKKSNDPAIQFQFAQYMLQTALLATTNSAGVVPKSPSFSALDAAGDDNDEDFALEFAPLPNHNQSSRASIMSSSGMTTAGADPASPALGPYTPKDEYRIKRGLLKESVALLRKLADKGYADAQYLLGDAYASGALGKRDLKESFALLQLAAKHGHAEASYRTALCLEEGWGTSKDPRRALQFLRQAASRNHPGAMLRLGVASFYGKLGLHMGLSGSNKVKVQQDGIRWLTRAADVANDIFPQGPYELAKIYEEGYRDLIFKDLQYAVQLYVKSADLGYVPAASKLGRAYEYGDLGCPQDAALSIHYYTIGAMGGDPAAMLAMCAWYMVGAEPMLPRNEDEAYEWAARAAERGLPKAQYAAGYFLENGIGTERDILQASRWFHKAAEGGDERAIERIKNNRILASKPNTKHRKKSTSNLRALVSGSAEGSRAASMTESMRQTQHQDQEGDLIAPQHSVRGSTSSPVPSHAPSHAPSQAPSQTAYVEQQQQPGLNSEFEQLSLDNETHFNGEANEAQAMAHTEGISVNEIADDPLMDELTSKKKKDKDCIIM